MNVQKSKNINLEEKICKNCVGFQDRACFRRPWIVLEILGPRFVAASDKCWKFKNKHMTENAR